MSGAKRILIGEGDWEGDRRESQGIGLRTCRQIVNLLARGGFKRSGELTSSLSREQDTDCAVLRHDDGTLVIIRSVE
jgi:hypothetical protein